jgi:hypothetical protein
VVSDPPGRTVRVDGRRRGVTPLRLKGLSGAAVRVSVSDPWYGTEERQVVLDGPRTFVCLPRPVPASTGMLPSAQPAECFGDSVGFAWSKVAGAREYTLQLFGTSGGTVRLIDRVRGIRDTSYRLKRILEPGMRYSYRVRPEDASGIPGPWSAAAPLEGQLVWRRVADDSDKASMIEHVASGVTFRDQMWIIGGFDNGSTWSSRDGTAWARRAVLTTFPPRSNCGLVIFEDRLWVIGGRTKTANYDDVWSSPDGSVWYEELEDAPFGPLSDFPLVGFGDALCLIGPGPGNQWKSGDGITWERWQGVPEGYWHSAGTFGDELWLFGERNGTATMARTHDGSQWSIETVPFPIRIREGMVATPAAVWILGGQSPDKRRSFRDAWYTNDGSEWKQSVAASAESFDPRSWFITLWYDGKIWVMGGFDEASQVYYKGVWCAEPAPWP